jgi:hypothetical protein
MKCEPLGAFAANARKFLQLINESSHRLGKL